MDDSELVAFALARSGLQAQIVRVDAEPDYVAQLGPPVPDVILCDYDMPRFSAERALAIIAERELDLPFIIVSNHIGESAAVMAMQQGASDYLAKHDLGRLAKAIGTAVDRVHARRERARAEAALRESEATMRGILESLDSRIAVLDRKGRVIAVNAAWHRFDPARKAAGYPAIRVGDNYLGILEAAALKGRGDAVEGLAAARSVIERRAPFAAVEYHLDMPGGTRWFVARATPLEGSDGGIVVAHDDVTNRMMSHLALEHAHARLKTLSNRVLSIQEDERRAISRELHDDAGQSLAALKIGLHRLARSGEPDPRLVDECIETVEDVIDRLRRIAHELRPPQLEQLGLADALRWLADRQARATGIEITCDFPGAGPGRHSSTLESACYRIAQEAISNATRHAHPTRVGVGAESDGKLLKLWVRDDGKGFDQEAERSRAEKGASLGLISMEERAQLAGGRVKIRSVRGGGTTVTALFPIQAA